MLGTPRTPVPQNTPKFWGVSTRPQCAFPRSHAHASWKLGGTLVCYYVTYFSILAKHLNQDSLCGFLMDIFQILRDFTLCWSMFDKYFLQFIVVCYESGYYRLYFDLMIFIFLHIYAEMYIYKM